MTQSQLSPLELSIDVLRVLRWIGEEHINEPQQNEVQFAPYFLDAFEERTPKVEDPNLVLDLCNRFEELIDEIEDETLNVDELSIMTTTMEFPAIPCFLQIMNVNRLSVYI